MQLLEKHKGMLYKICRLYQDRTEDQEDLLQDIIAQLWTSYDSFRGDSEFSTWMYRVALNTAIMFFKKDRRHSSHMSHMPYPDLAAEIQPVHEQQDRLAIFHQAIARLNQLEKALIFCYMEGRSGQETALILGISHASMRTRLTRTKDKLQTIIKTMGYEF